MATYAEASIPWQLVVAVIVFNIVVGMLSKRKQKPPAKRDPGAVSGSNQGAGKAEARKAEAQRRMEESRAARERAHAERKASERETRRARDGAGAQDDEEESAEPSPVPAQAKDLGKNLLETLARELGLELPTPSQPAPKPQPAGSPSGESPTRPAGRSTEPYRPERAERTARPAPPARQPARPAARPAWKAGEAEDENDEHSGSLADLNARTRSGPREGDADARPAPASPYADTLRAAPVSAAAAGLDNPEALRKAFILKTLLDKPLALRPRR